MCYLVLLLLLELVLASLQLLRLLYDVLFLCVELLISLPLLSLFLQ